MYYLSNFMFYLLFSLILCPLAFSASAGCGSEEVSSVAPSASCASASAGCGSEEVSSGIAPSASSAGSTVCVAGRTASILAAAFKGDAEAEYQAGHIYRKGLDMKKPNLTQAFRWYLKAAEQKHLKAIQALSRMPVDLPRSPETDAAMKVWSAYAEAGDPDAQFRLAVELLRERWVKPDEKVANEWLKKASKQGHGLARDLLKALRGKSTPLKIEFPHIIED